MKKVLFCFGLAVLTYLCISFLPVAASTFSEVLLTPGALLAALAWPEGLHSDQPIVWLALATLINLAIFFLFWFVVAGVVARFKAPRKVGEVR